MPSIKYIFQGLEKDEDHLSAVEQICSLDNIEKILFSIAFMRKSGIDLVEEYLKKYSKKIEIFIGIRNGVTSIQAILRLLKLGIKPIAVDTASPSILFHPKVFLSKSKTRASILIGSANLTSGGLIQNIEAGTLIELDLSNENESKLAGDIEKRIYQLSDNNPENIFEIKTIRQAYEIFKEGRLIDEKTTSTSNVTGKRAKEKTDDISRISVNIRSKIIRSKKARKRVKVQKIPIAQQSRTEWHLLWESNPLTERDLNIPSGTTTNPTGSMLLKKGNMENIDHRHFFRDGIFNDLSWANDTSVKLTHLERANTNFELIIKGISYGVFNLKLTHNTRTDSTAYFQRNAMSQIHWGEVRKYIARRDLLNCIFRLYKPINSVDRYIIDIS